MLINWAYQTFESTAKLLIIMFMIYGIVSVMLKAFVLSLVFFTLLVSWLQVRFIFGVSLVNPFERESDETEKS